MQAHEPVYPYVFAKRRTQAPVSTLNFEGRHAAPARPVKIIRRENFEVK